MCQDRPRELLDDLPSRSKALDLVGIGPTPDDKDVEITVLRHQLAVLGRPVARPRFSPTDHVVLARLARLLPRERWATFLVRPATLMRWHRELVADTGPTRLPRTSRPTRSMLRSSHSSLVPCLKDYGDRTSPTYPEITERPWSARRRSRQHPSPSLTVNAAPLLSRP